MFVQIIRAKAADPGGIRKEMDRWQDELAPGAEGWLGVTAGLATNGEYWSVVRFESEEAARRNSDRPEQGAWWNEMSRHFDGEATFYECTDPQVWGGGGSDEAGFVQIMSGVAKDRAKFEEMMQSADDEEMRKARPDVIGGTYCRIGDNEFVTTAYFTSEAEARKGEQNDTQAPGEQWGDLIEKMDYADITEPYLVSK